MIKIILSAANMGDVDETDFDLWHAFVAEKIDSLVGHACEVEQARFGEAGEDRISGASEYQCDVIRGLLSVTLWEAFCGEEWTTRRKAHDASAQTGTAVGFAS